MLRSVFSRRSSSRVVPISVVVAVEHSKIEEELNELRRENKLLRDALSKTGTRIAGLEQEKDQKRLIQEMSSVYGPILTFCPRDGSSSTSAGQRGNSMQLVINEIDRMSRELDITNGLLKDHSSEAKNGSPMSTINEMSTININDVRGLEDAHWRITQLNRSIGENRSYVLGLMGHQVAAAVDQPQPQQQRQRIRRPHGDGFIIVHAAGAGVGAWSETAACSGFEVSNAIPRKSAAFASLSDDVVVCELE